MSQMDKAHHVTTDIFDTDLSALAYYEVEILLAMGNSFFFGMEDIIKCKLVIFYAEIFLEYDFLEQTTALKTLKRKLK